MAVLTLKLPDDVREVINRTAKEDFRKQQDQLRWLIDLGLRERRRLNANKSDGDALSPSESSEHDVDQRQSAVTSESLIGVSENAL